MAIRDIKRKDILRLIVLPSITIKSEKYNKRDLPHHTTQKIKVQFKMNKQHM